MTQPNQAQATTLASFKRAKWMKEGVDIPYNPADIALYLIERNGFQRVGSEWVLSDTAMHDALVGLDQRRDDPAPATPREPWWKRIMRRGDSPEQGSK